MLLDEYLKEHGTVDKHAAGAKMEIAGTDQWLKVAGLDSETGQRVQWEILRLDYNEFSSVQRSIELHASLILGWSFDDELTLESATMLLKKHPAVFAELTRFVRDNANFTSP